MTTLNLSEVRKLLVNQMRQFGEAIAENDLADSQSKLGEVTESLERVLSDIEKWSRLAASQFQAAQTASSEFVSSINWMNSRTRITSQKPLEEMDAGIAAATIGIEVFGFTKLTPGPPMFDELVNRAVGDAKASESLSLSALRSRRELESILGPYIPTQPITRELTPLLSMFVSDRDTLASSFQDLEEVSLSVHMVALQILRETQLIALLEGSDS